MSTFIDPAREIDAMATLRAAYERQCADDPEFTMALAEGETSILEALDLMAAQELELGCMIAALDAALSTLSERQRRFAARQTQVRALIEQAMMLLDIRKLERPGATFSLAHRAPKAAIDDESQVPARFFVPGDPKLDRKALKSALEAGEAVPGAHLSNGGVSLTVRRR